MKGEELKIIFIHDKAYLTEDSSLSFDQLGLPDIAKPINTPAYWKIEVLNYIEEQKKIYCKIIGYEIGKTHFAENQRLLYQQLRNIEKISFNSIDTSGLLYTFSQKNRVQNRNSNQHFKTQNSLIESKPIPRLPIKKTLNKTLSIPFKDIYFKNGGVAFDIELKELKKIIGITISNIEIREEFDAIKNYFANVLNAKKIHVTIKLEITDNEITSVEAKSHEIDKIDKQIIDNVKLKYVKSTFRKKENIENSKNILTMDELLDTYADVKVKSKTFYNNEKELLDDLLKISNTKHFKNLRFLSNIHKHDIMKLRFVHKPFSFLFLLEGDSNYHLAWETLNTKEATYIWHTDKNLDIVKLTMRKIEDIINEIKVQGKVAYISLKEDQFERIYHDYTELEGGFIKWKGELESKLK